MTAEHQYLALLNDVLETGDTKSDRTGTGTRSVFGRTLRFPMTAGFPLLTTKRVWFKGIATELLWFISGSTTVHDLWPHNIHIWDEWADPETGQLAPIYGAQWRSWRSWQVEPNPSNDASFVKLSPLIIDQLAQAEDTLRANPDSRRIVVSTWNVGELEAMHLPPCHLLFQLNSRPDTERSYADTPLRQHHDGTYRRLDLQVYQRSADLFLGVPFNIASYALLLHMLAQTTGHIPGNLIWVGGDIHLYENHLNQAREQRCREPRDAPRLHLDRSVCHLDDFELKHIHLNGYSPHPPITAPIAV